MIDISHILKEHGLKNTPQRYCILQAVFEIGGHPTVEDITLEIHQSYPNISLGTVYNVLNMFVEKDILNRVKTDNDVMRFEVAKNNHHHLYSYLDSRIEDYYNEELDGILKDYFREHEIANFDIKEIKLQIVGKFRKNK